MSQDSFFGSTEIRTITPEVERAVEKLSDLAGFRHREPPPDPPKRRRGNHSTPAQFHHAPCYHRRRTIYPLVRGGAYRLPGRLCATSGEDRRGVVGEGGRWVRPLGTGRA